MGCDTVLERIAAGEALTGAERRHVDQCAACAQAQAIVAVLSDPAPDTPYAPPRAPTAAGLRRASLRRTGSRAAIVAIPVAAIAVAWAVWPTPEPEPEPDLLAVVAEIDAATTADVEVPGTEALALFRRDRWEPPAVLDGLTEESP